jgi:Tfp pilus assembly protein PilF
MKTLSKVTALALFISLTGAVYSAPTFAKPDPAKIEERKTRKSKVMSERTGKKVVRAFDVYNGDKEKGIESDIAGALAMLKEIDPSDKFDKAQVNYYLSQMSYQLEKYDDAIQLAQDAAAPDLLNYKDQATVLKLVADLQRQEKRFKDAIASYNAWMDFTGEEDPKVYLAIAAIHYETKQFQSIIEPADRAIELSKLEPIKNAYDLKIGAYVELKQYNNAVKTSEEQVKIWPTEYKLWTRLASFYMSVEDYKKGLAAAKVAEVNGALETENHFKFLASLYSLNEMPYYAGTTLEKAIKSENVKKTKSTISTLGAYFHNAKHYEKAAKLYVEAANFDNDSELYRKAGSMLVTSENYSLAVKNLKKALELGNKKEGQIYLDLAEAYLQQEKYKLAYQSVRKATEYPKTKRFAKGWSGYIKDKAIRKGVKI